MTRKSKTGMLWNCCSSSFGPLTVTLIGLLAPLAAQAESSTLTPAQAAASDFAVSEALANLNLKPVQAVSVRNYVGQGKANIIGMEMNGVNILILRDPMSNAYMGEVTLKPDQDGGVFVSKITGAEFNTEHEVKVPALDHQSDEAVKVLSGSESMDTFKNDEAEEPASGPSETVPAIKAMTADASVEYGGVRQSFASFAPDGHGYEYGLSTNLGKASAGGEVGVSPDGVGMNTEFGAKATKVEIFVNYLGTPSQTADGSYTRSVLGGSYEMHGTLANAEAKIGCFEDQGCTAKTSWGLLGIGAGAALTYIPEQSLAVVPEPVESDAGIAQPAPDDETAQPESSAGPQDNTQPDQDATTDQTQPDQNAAPDQTQPDQALPDENAAPDQAQTDQAQPDQNAVPDQTQTDQTHPDENAAPDQTQPDQAMPDQSAAPDQTQTDQSQPDENAAPDQTQPEQAMPDQNAAPDQAQTDQSQPDQNAAPDQTQPDQVMPDQNAAPDQAQTDQSQPDQNAAPDQTQPDQAMPDQDGTTDQTQTDQAQPDENSEPDQAQPDQTQQYQSQPDASQDNQPQSTSQPDASQPDETQQPTYNSPQPEESEPAQADTPAPEESAPEPTYSPPPEESEPAPSYSPPPEESAPAPAPSSDE